MTAATGFKCLGIAITAVVLVVIAALGALTLLIPHDSVRDAVKAEIRGVTGLDVVLRGGADDLGGLLLDGSVRPDAGAEAGLQLTAADVVAVAARLGRTPRQRTTTYADVPAERRLPLPPP